MMQPGAWPSLELTDNYATSCRWQARWLLLRALRVFWRSPGYIFVRTFLTLTFAVIFGAAYWRMGWTQRDVFLRLSWNYTTTFYVGLTFMISGMCGSLLCAEGKGGKVLSKGGC